MGLQQPSGRQLPERSQKLRRRPLGSERRLERWAELHTVRTVLSLAATMLYLALDLGGNATGV